MFTWFLRVLESVSFCGHMCFPLCQKLRKVWLVESQVERFLSVRSDRNIAALWSTRSGRNFPFHFDKSVRCCNSPLQQNFTYVGDWGNESKMVTAIPFSWPGLIEKWRSTLLGQSHWSLTGQSDIITRQDILLTQHPVLQCYAFLIVRASCPHKQPVRIFGNETSVQFSENLSPRSWLIKLCVSRATFSEWGRESMVHVSQNGGGLDTSLSKCAEVVKKEFAPIVKSSLMFQCGHLPGV